MGHWSKPASGPPMKLQHMTGNLRLGVQCTTGAPRPLAGPMMEMGDLSDMTWDVSASGRRVQEGMHSNEVKYLLDIPIELPSLVAIKMKTPK